MKPKGRVQIFLHDLRLPRDERKAARQERRAEEAMRRQRDDVAYSESARKAVAEAERQRWSGGPYFGGGG